MGYHPTHGPWVTNYLQLRVKWAAGLKLEFSPGLVSRLHHLLVGPQDVTSLPLNLSLSYNSKHWWCFFPLAYMLIFWAGYFPYGCGKSLFPWSHRAFCGPRFSAWMALCSPDDIKLVPLLHEAGQSSPTPANLLLGKSNHAWFLEGHPNGPGN